MAIIFMGKQTRKRNKYQYRFTTKWTQKGNKMISDKLLGEMLNESILNSVIEGNTLYWQAETIDLMGTQTGQINIYELAHKVKEWVFYRVYANEQWDI
jgi:hypothetical protein